MIPADLKDILGDTYNDYFFNNGRNYSKILESEGILIFNSFINRKGLINLQKEAADLKDWESVLASAVERIFG